ncbi:MAG TPA: acyltransferase [Kofleriaceae bacterium]
MIRTALARLYSRVVDERTGSGWRIPALDGLRGVAALMVLVAHTRQQTVPDDSPIWAPIERGGLGGVVLFFALSGFLLYLPWLRATVEHKPPPRFRQYAIRRCLRIMPAYYFSVIVLAIVRVTIGHRDPIGFLPLALHFVFLQSLMTPIQSVYWTLQVEEFFYWLLPLLHRFIERWGIALLFGATVVLSTAWGFTSFLLPEDKRGIWMVETPFYLPAFVLGITTAIAWKKKSTPGRSYVWLGIATYVAMAPLLYHFARDEAVLTPVTELAIAPAASAVVLGVARTGNRFLEHPIMRFLGAISFSLYLWHQAILRAVPVPHSIVHSFLPRLGFTLALSIPVALASYLFVERPFLKLRPTHS